MSEYIDLILLAIFLGGGAGMFAFAEHRYRAGYRAGHIAALEYARRHINLLSKGDTQ